MSENISLPISHCPNCRVGLRFDRSIKSRVRCPRCNYSGAASTYSIEGVCPYCGQKGLIKNEKAAKVVCPHCRQTTTVDRFLGRGSGWMRDAVPPVPVPPTPHTPPTPQTPPIPPIPYPGENTGGNGVFPKTEINIGPINNMRPGSLTLVADPKGTWYGDRSPICLTFGTFTFGRKASDSTADIQLPTKDNTISRMHFRIEMIAAGNGDLQHRLSDAGSSNGTYCNDLRVNPGEIIFLSPGNLIRVGTTVFKFDII